MFKQLSVVVIFATCGMSAMAIGQEATPKSEDKIKALQAEVNLLRTTVDRKIKENEKLQSENTALAQQVKQLQDALKKAGIDLSGNPNPSSVSTQPTNNKTVANNPNAQEPQGDSWISAEKAVKQGDIQIRIVSAKVGKVQVKNEIDGQMSSSKDVLLAITIELTNLSQTKKQDYKTWAGADFAIKRDYGTLVDNFGNSYKRVGFSLNLPVGAVKSESIYPGKTITDVLLFEAPIEKAECLRLELPAKNIDGTGMIRLQIPKSMISR